MIQVTRKDANEDTANMLRRFSRKVLQAGKLPLVKAAQYFSKPISKGDRRKRAILRRARKAEKFKKMRMGGGAR